MAKELTAEEKINALKAKANALAKKIDELNAIAGDNDGMRFIFSPMIMQMLRAECVYISGSSEDIKKKYETSSTVTLNPAELLASLPDKPDKEYQPIFANSFGPWNAKFYFSDECKYRILWILKEPYNTKWDYGDRGGHNQAEEYNNYKNIDNPTLSTIISVSKSILEKLLPNKSLTEEDVMGHICIIEANHFPGLAFEVTHTDDKKETRTDDKKETHTDNKIIGEEWIQKINGELLSELINFYNPLIVLGPRVTLDYTVNEVGADFFNWIRKNVYIQNPKTSIIIEPLTENSDIGSGNLLDDEPSVLGRKVAQTGNLSLCEKEKVQESKEEKNDSDSNYMGAVLDKKGTLWISWYHPANFGKWSEDVIKQISDFIDEVITQLKK